MLADLLRAGHAAGFDMFTIDADLRPGVARVARGSPAGRPRQGHPTKPGRATAALSLFPGKISGSSSARASTRTC